MHHVMKNILSQDDLKEWENERETRMDCYDAQRIEGDKTVLKECRVNEESEKIVTTQHGVASEVTCWF